MENSKVTPNSNDNSKPARLGLDPNSPDALEEWKAWQLEFDVFVSDIDEANKLALLCRHLTYPLYRQIADVESYDDAITQLTQLFSVPKNEISARQLLLTRQQSSRESIDDFVNELQRLSRYCKFKAVSSAQYCEEVIRDSLLCGVESDVIRTTLLESGETDLNKLIRKARALEKGEKAYISPKKQRKPSVDIAATTSVNPTAEKRRLSSQDISPTEHSSPQSLSGVGPTEPSNLQSLPDLVMISSYSSKSDSDSEASDDADEAQIETPPQKESPPDLSEDPMPSPSCKSDVTNADEEPKCKWCQRRRHSESKCLKKRNSEFASVFSSVFGGKSEFRRRFSVDLSSCEH